MLIAEEKVLQRVQALFKESFFGPDPSEIYLEEDISPAKRAEGLFSSLSLFCRPL
jgi:hypothetical protein